MPDLNQNADYAGDTNEVGAQPSRFDFSEVGQHVAFDWVPEPMYTADDVYVPEEFEDDGSRDTSPLSEAARNALIQLDLANAKTDVAPRRIEIEQVWKSDHYDRGYQFLLHHRNGGWTMPGFGTGFGTQDQKQITELYHTNVYGEKGEIIVAALSRDVPKVEFFPADPSYGPDEDMASVSDDLKDIWAKNNDLHKIVRDAAKIFWNEDRCLFWTRYELNGEKYGYEVDDEPVVPETELLPLPGPTDTEGSTQYQETNESSVDVAAPRKPRGRVITTAEGKLDHKVPIYVNDVSEMGYVSICKDVDVSIARAMFPWMKDKVKGGGDGTGEIELDRIARENVRAAVPGQYVTGDSLNRHCVIKHSYIRRAMFWSPDIKEEVRAELLDKFPDGVKLVKAATEFAYARNECIDDHCVIGHPFSGNGQNRRSLGESLIPIQDYLNELVSLALDFFKRTVPKKWMDAEAFNIESLKNQTNVPGSIGPFQRVPGVPTSELIFVEPTPQPQPGLHTFIQWIIGSLAEQISGALPSLFGAAISGQVGSEGVAVQRDQAMQRVGCPWNALQTMFAETARQAVMLTARCTNKDINDVIPGKGRIQIKVNNLKGNVLCYPESNPEFPESWAQKEARVMQIVDQALASPSSGISQMILDPRNVKEIQSVLRLRNFKIKGADAVAKQEGEFELLLRSGPLLNPEKMKLQAVLAQAAAPPTPEDAAMLAQIQPMLQQIQAQVQQMPDFISSVPVRGDGSEDDETEASVCFDWMNGKDGRKFAAGSPEQKAAFENVHLHWKAHNDADQARKAAVQQGPGKPPSISIQTDKMPPEVQAEIVQAAGLPADPTLFAQHAVTEQNRKIQAKVVPDTVYTANLHKPEAPSGPKV